MSGEGRGIYETLITAELAERLRGLSKLSAVSGPLRAADAADRIALHVSRLIERSVQRVAEDQRVDVAIQLVNSLIEHLSQHTRGAVARTAAPLSPASVLEAIVGYLPDGSGETIRRPLIPLLDTTLLTNAPGEPRIGSQIAAEIESSDAIDVIMAFIRYSGIRPLIEPLRRHCAAFKPLRVLTTVYTGSTEGRALDMLKDLGAEILVSYDTTATRLHAKGWLFRRHSGFTTAYIGSSNLTHSAQQDGIEWNVRISAARNSSVVQKFEAVFESYWNSIDFRGYDSVEFAASLSRQRTTGDGIFLAAFGVEPHPFQERLLEQLTVSRERGDHRNLLVAATGTGKTVMAALDYANLRSALPRARLLFVAHREEILKKSLMTFRLALREPSFGELWVGAKRPQLFEHVFASIQSLFATGFEHVAADHFDVVIIDEFHHAAAQSYDSLLSHLQPRELLGLTATPERADGLSVLHWFGGKIAAELRLWDAIEQHRLCPFAYYGIHDGTDLRSVPWRRSHSYDVEALTNVLTADNVWAHLVIRHLREIIGDLSGLRCLGFCVSVRHALFMARVFNEAGISAAAVSAETPSAQRYTALRELETGALRVLFSVDLFNEGIDLPSLNALLLLRPTDSPTLFLQQLGRGLRRHQGKSICTVLDFVGHHRKEFRFDRRLRALLGGTRATVEKQVAEGFPFLPAGCHMQLDLVAQEIILRSIRGAIPSQWPAKVQELLALKRERGSISLKDFLEASGLELEDIYQSGRCWSELRASAGFELEPPGRNEAQLRSACGRLLHIDDGRRIDIYVRLLSGDLPDVDLLPVDERRALRMLVASLMDKVLAKDAHLQAATHDLWAHPQLRAELLELLPLLKERINHVQARLAYAPEVPLLVHARYTRIEILAAFGVGDAAKTPAWREGVRYVPNARTDLLVFTLDKTKGDFSPTTRYRDYAVSRELIHWESQSTIGPLSATGKRYQHHRDMGTSIMLFARLNNDERAFWFLGPAEYKSHSGEMPMAITWRLLFPLPGDLFSQFAAAVA